MAGEVESRKKGLSGGTKGSIRRAVITLAVIGIGSAIVYNRVGTVKEATLAGVAMSTGTVAREDISQRISSAETTATKDTYPIISLVPSDTIAETNFRIGDRAIEDWILYRFDSTFVASDVKDMENVLSRTRKALANTQVGLSDTQGRYGDGVYKAACAGHVTEVYMIDGEKIGTGNSLIDSTDETMMNVHILFFSGEIELTQVESPTTLTLSGTMEQIEGTVAAVGAQEKALSNSRLIGEVTVSLRNPGGTTGSTAASVVVNGFRCVEEGRFEAQLFSSMTADLGSAVDGVNILVRIGNYIQPDTPVFTMTVRSAKDALQGYPDKVGVAESSIESTQKTLDSAKETLNNYTVRLSIDGEVITKNYRVGDKIGGVGVSDGQSATTPVIIYDMSSYDFKMAIDETDASEIQLGQHVEIIADALPEETFSGTVMNISLESTSQNGVSTYPMQVTPNNTEKLLPGMNVNAKILVGSMENALCIPADALLRDNKVYVRDPSVTEAEDAAPAGFHEEVVEIGLIGVDKVQITSGNLKGGNEIYVQSKVTDSGVMMMNDRATEGGGDSGAENAEGDGQQGGGGQGSGENGQS